MSRPNSLISQKNNNSSRGSLRSRGIALSPRHKVKAPRNDTLLNPLIIILGPTASGKTSLAVKLTAEFNGEIISADSRQIYQEMNIGTAKPTKQEIKKIRHHLIDLVNPDQDFSLAQFKKLALEKIKQIHQKGKVPFLVGGTGLYIKSIVDNLTIPSVKADKKLRQKLEKQTTAKLYQQLKKLDPESLKFIDQNNKRRIIRALEVCLLTKKPFSRQRTKGKKLFDCLQIGLKLDLDILDRRINQRTDQMIKQGLVKEVKQLIKKYDQNLPAMTSIGYQEIISHLNNQISLAQAIELIKRHTRQYGRRQMTWFKHDKRIHWIENKEQAQKLVKNHLKDYS